jgi:primosomal protein N' (replication factor Y)
MTVAVVVVDVRTRNLDRPFDYSIPERLRAKAVVGAPVRVPFGGRPAVGYVVALAEESDVADLKEVEEVLGEPLFGEHVPKIAAWIAKTWVTGLAEGLRPFLPPGGTPRVRRADNGSYSLEQPSAAGVDERWVEAAPSASSAKLRRGAIRQRAVLDAVAGGPVRMAELRAELGDVNSAVTRLAELGHVRVTEARRWRDPDVRPLVHPPPERLTSHQEEALRAIGQADPGETILLDGVTGSGKTEVYLQAIDSVLSAGRSAIVLVPEISLTPQTVGRFRARFGSRVAVLHSRLSAGERFDQWELARTGRAPVVVGPRSALFAPVRSLALVVIDEEHEASYKQGSAPRYHARTVGRRLCEATGSVLVLGSATPSLESRRAADTGAVRRVHLPTRATGARMPNVEVVDMAREFANGNRSMFSGALRRSLARVESRGEKAIVLLNRRGFASFLLCRECGHVPQCDSCSVSMTYHDVGSRLACHHCGAVREVPAACPECGSPYLRQFGAGTQRVESELRSTFPDLTVVRMDADTTARKGGHEARLAEFEELESGILLGTQMIAKGLDFPEVTLVGVLSADLGLRIPDFRAGERTFQLLEQVAGRAGRAERPGEVVVQTYWPEHPAIRAAACHDAEIFYAAESDSRRELGYPPYGSLARVVVSGRDPGAVRAHADDLAAELRRSSRDADTLTVLGPSAAPIARVRGVSRWHILLKGSVEDDMAGVLRAGVLATPAQVGVSVAPDVDPYDLM